jgi:Protein of unknown function (DUF3551)
VVRYASNRTKEIIMRKLLLAVLALSAAGVATLATSAPAAAYDYPWCVQGRGVGIPGDCSYQTYGQCQASASGRGLYCNSNPRAALNRMPQRSRVPRGYYDY